MAILRDSRADKYRDVGASFTSIQCHEGQPTYYPPGTGGATYFLGPKLGVPRRWFYGPHPIDNRGVWWAVEPKVGNGGPRSEASYPYEAATVTRFFMWRFHLPAFGPLAWLTDPLSYCIVGQWHENFQPNGGRAPPFGVAVYEDSSGIRLKVSIGHDNGTGTSGTLTYPEIIVEFELGNIVRGQDYTVAVNCRAQGAVGDFLKLWLGDTQFVNYTGYVGYPHANGSGDYPNYDGSGTYDQQNFFKTGAYCYMATTSPQMHRSVVQCGVVIGDQNETFATMAAAYAATPVITSHARTRIAVAVLGGTNVAGGSGSGATNRALYGSPCQDPVAPATAVLASLVPALSNRLSERGFGVNAANCALTGAGITTYVGRCRGTHATTTVYLPGDIVTPAAPVGVTSFISLGLKYVCEVGGTSAGSVPIWPTLEFGSVVDNGITWRAERRESYDTANHTYTFGELGFDPLGLLSQAMAYVDQIPGADRKVLLVMPDLDPAQNINITAAIDSLTSFAGQMSITVIRSAQSFSGIADDAQLGIIGRAAASEI